MKKIQRRFALRIILSAIFYIAFLFIGLFSVTYINLSFIKSEEFQVFCSICTYFIALMGFRQEFAENFDLMNKEIEKEKDKNGNIQ